MKRRILIPTEDPDGNSVASHFGRAPYFAAVEIDETGAVTEKTVHPNTGEHLEPEACGSSSEMRLVNVQCRTSLCGYFIVP